MPNITMKTKPSDDFYKKNVSSASSNHLSTSNVGQNVYYSKLPSRANNKSNVDDPLAEALSLIALDNPIERGAWDPDGFLIPGERTLKYEESAQVKRSQEARESLEGILPKLKGDIQIPGDPYNQTLLHYAIKDLHLERLKILVEHCNTWGININSKDSEGRTPLHLAISASQRTGSLDYIDVLLKSGSIDVNAQDNYGRTALHVAAERSYLPAVKQLLHAGIDCNIKNNANQTPLDVMLSNQHSSFSNDSRDIISLLSQKTASDMVDLATIDPDHKLDDIEYGVLYAIKCADGKTTDFLKDMLDMRDMNIKAKLALNSDYIVNYSVNKLTYFQDLLNYALDCNKPDIAQYLIEYFDKLNAENIRSQASLFDELSPILHDLDKIDPDHKLNEYIENIFCAIKLDNQEFLQAILPCIDQKLLEPNSDYASELLNYVLDCNNASSEYFLQKCFYPDSTETNAIGNTDCASAAAWNYVGNNLLNNYELPIENY